MNETNYNQLSDLGKIKETLVSLFQTDADIAKLSPNCFDTPYIEGIITDSDCGIFVETHLIKVANQRFKEVGVNIYVVCHKDSIALSEEDNTYFNSVGIYGNRIDSTVQAIHAAIINPETMTEIKKRLSIGDLTLIEEEPIKLYLTGTDFYGKQMSYTYQAFFHKK